MRKALLVLENGSLYEGDFIGAGGEKVGWVSFNTGIVGYQEIMTSPSNTGKIIVMTYPLIGNYGVAKKFMESDKIWINGLIIKEKTRITSNWQSEKSLHKFLRKNNVLCMQNLDTRALMIELREEGEQSGIISTKDFNLKNLLKKIQNKKEAGVNKLNDISVKKITRLNQKHGQSIAVLDIGITNSIINQLKNLDCNITLFPYNTSSNSILKISPEKLVISDGPEKDEGLKDAVDTIKGILGNLPILGIGTGCQVLAQALGAKIKRMHLGHHGLNYPIVKPNSLEGVITTQNHSFIIDKASLKDKDINVIWHNVNDKTIEGIECKKFNALGYQFYPAPPGIGEINPFLGKFIKQRNQ